MSPIIWFLIFPIFMSFSFCSLRLLRVVNETVLDGCHRLSFNVHNYIFTMWQILADIFFITHSFFSANSRIVEQRHVISAGKKKLWQKEKVIILKCCGINIRMIISINVLYHFVSLLLLFFFVKPKWITEVSQWWVFVNACGILCLLLPFFFVGFPVHRV